MIPKPFAIATLFATSMLAASFAQAQTPDGCVQWKTYTDTVWVDQDVTEDRVINETSYETKEVTKSRPRWVSEEFQRTITEEKPVQQTSQRVVTRTVSKPVTTTKTRIKTRVEETFEDVTEMRDETYTVRKPVVETTYQSQQVRVRKPVTTRTMEKESVTVFRPQETTQTNLIPGTLLVPGGSNANTRPRIRFLQRGYYTDPITGQSVYRRPGLHWVNQQQSIPVTVPQQQTSVTLVPETIVNEKPVETTTFVDEFETRKVPIETTRMVEETKTRKVPVTVRIPKRKIIEEKIPYTETTYVDETTTETVPYTETVMKTVTRKEPYTVMKESWQNYTETTRVPTTVTKKVPYVARYRVPYLVEVRVPLDANGNPVARGQQVAGTHRLHPAWRKMITKVEGAEATPTIVKESSVLVKPDANAATFDVPANQRSVTEASGSLGSAPNPKFRTGIAEKTVVMKPIAKPKAVAPPQPAETAASKELDRRIARTFSQTWPRRRQKCTANSETVQTTETAAGSNRRLKVDSPPPAKIDFNPEHADDRS